MKQIQNNQKSIRNSIPAYGFLKSKEKKSAKQKSQDFCQTLVISKKKTMPEGMDLKICRKSIEWPMDFYSL
jgi:hypothetical protein